MVLHVTLTSAGRAANERAATVKFHSRNGVIARIRNLSSGLAIVAAVKRIALIALASLLAACDTMYDPYGYPSDPYGYPPYPAEPYPTVPPYPPYPPYPPADPYPPAGPYPPYPPYPPVGGVPPIEQPFACPISGSSEWRAWVNRMPGGTAQPYLFVTGKVTTPTGGYQVALQPDLQVAESYPVQAFATLRVVPPAGPATQVIVTHNVRYQWPMSQPVGRVVIRCGDRTLAEISPVQTAQ